MSPDTETTASLVWKGSYTPGGALVAVDTWHLNGEVVGLRGVAQRLDGQGSPVGKLVPQPVLGRQEGELQRTPSLEAPARGVWSEGSHVSIGYRPLRALGLSCEPEPPGLSELCVVRGAPEGHVLVGLACEQRGDALVTVTGYFDRLDARVEQAVGEGRTTSSQGPRATAADGWMNTLINELLALRDAAASRWSYWPADERRLVPMEVVVPVPDLPNRVLWVRARHGVGVVTPLRAQAGGVDLEVTPQDWGDPLMLYRVSLDALPPGPTPLSLSVAEDWLLVMWLELTAGAAPV